MTLQGLIMRLAAEHETWDETEHRVEAAYSALAGYMFVIVHFAPTGDFAFSLLEKTKEER